MAGMPFRIKVSLALLALLAGAVLIGPLLWPAPPLEDVQPAVSLADDEATWLDAGGVRLHAAFTPPARADDRPTPGFVLLHGFASTLRTWDLLAPRLASRAPTLAFDRPAFGLSERPTPYGDATPYRPDAQVAQTLAAMDAAGADTAVLIGHSSGALLALRTALAHPERVSGLVLIGPAVYTRGGAPAGTRWLLHTPQLNRIGPLLLRQMAGASTDELLRAAYADPDRLYQPAREAAQQAMRVEGWDRALWAFTKARRSPRLAGRLDDLRIPVLVLRGEEDTVVPEGDAERLVEALPAARATRLAGCGHALHEECPEAASDAILAWLDEAHADGPP